MASIVLNLIFDGKNGARANLRTVGGHAFTLPESHVPNHCKPGETFCMDFEKAAYANIEPAERLRMAKAVLNELLRIA